MPNEKSEQNSNRRKVKLSSFRSGEFNRDKRDGRDETTIKHYKKSDFIRFVFIPFIPLIPVKKKVH
jgi:hypothetical protein